MSDAPRFGPFELLRKLSMGGTSVVFAARRVEGAAATGLSSEIVALKRLLPHAQQSPGLVAMFLHEGALLCRLEHPLIAGIRSVGEVDGNHYITMEFVPGRDLRAFQKAFIASGVACSTDFALAIGAQAATALAYAHEFADATRPLNIVHRDISPQNLMVSRAGAFKLIDFGIARFDGPRDRTQTGVLKGKHAYMSPEQVRGERVDHRSDIFSLGVTLYELVAGRRLFKGDSLIDTLSRVEAAAVPPLPGAGRDPQTQALHETIMACLARAPADRPPTARAVAQALEPHAKPDQAPQQILSDAYEALFGDAPQGLDLPAYQQRLRELELGEDEGARESSDITLVAGAEAVKAYLAAIKAGVADPGAPAVLPDVSGAES